MKKSQSLSPEPMIQYSLFAILVVMTPFMVVTRFLQGAVYEFSHLKLPIFGFEAPIVATTAIIALCGFLIYVSHEFTVRRIKAASVIIGLILLSYRVQDLYGGMALYDLQKNWHYVAYAAYIYFFFRAFNSRKMPIPRMILFSFLSAVLLSTFDEAFQFKMSNRIFDVSDISKDSLGAVIGLILVLFVSETYGRVEFDLRSIWRKKFGEYFREPQAVMVLTGLFSVSSIVISPLMTEASLLGYFLLALLSFYLTVILILHKLQHRMFRLVAAAVFGLGVVGLGGSVAVHASAQVVKSSYGLTMFRGIPIPYFDLLVYPNGLPRLVDKKHFFNNQDKQFLMEQRPDILVVGSGHHDQGGKGFAVSKGTYFSFNRYLKRGTQIIVLPSTDACKEYDRLCKEGKRVMLVLHSTC